MLHGSGESKGDESMSASNFPAQGASNPEAAVNTIHVDATGNASVPAEGDELYPAGTPDPKGTNEAQETQASRENSSDPAAGAGVEGELTVWEARYSNRNFIGRGVVRLLLTIALGGLAYSTWGAGHVDLAVPTYVGAAVVAVLWIALIWRMIQAHYSHYYRLTNRRLFVSTGVFNRRRDMMELLRVKDVFTRQQSLWERWLSLGTVVVVPTEKELPTFYLAGVGDPKGVMDLIWHHARAERDHRTVMVDSV